MTRVFGRTFWSSLCLLAVCIAPSTATAAGIVAITEVNYDQTSSEQEFIELLASGAAVDITGWTIADQDEMSYVIGQSGCTGPIVLNSGERLVLWQGSGTSVCTGTSRKIYMSRSTFLQKEGDDLVLKSGDGTCRSYVAFETGSSVNAAPPGCAWSGPNQSNGNVAGVSVSRFDGSPLADGNRGSDWERSGATSTIGPKTPGAANQGVTVACTMNGNCADTNPCTDDVCQNPGTSQAVCTHNNNTASCNDGNACTGPDVCSNGTCGGPTNTASCNDGNACTGPDVCSNGTCGGPIICSAVVKLNEVFYDQDGGQQEFVELYVPAGPVDLTGWSIADQDEMTYVIGQPANPSFPCTGPFTVNTGDRVVLWQGAGTSVCSGAVRQIFMNRPAFLQKEGDDIVLRNGTNACQDYVAFETGVRVNAVPAGCAWTIPNPTNGDMLGRSISRFDNPFTDTDRGSDWERSGTTSTTGPKSPGAANVSAPVIACSTNQQCADTNVCTDDVCQNPGTPQSVCTRTNNSASCNDNNVCTSPDVCSNGVCGGANVCACSTNAQCADTNVCTDDVCQNPGTPQSVCIHTNNSASCNDSNVCTSPDVCSNGVCGGPNVCGCSTNAQCADTNVCTDDVCQNPGTPQSVCIHTNNSASCNDNNVCTSPDVCSNGVCGGANVCACSTNAQCADTNVCTDDVCQDPGTPQAVCAHINNTASCSDGNTCTAPDTCANGSCGAGPNVCACSTDADCSDGNPCTDDTCQQPATPQAACAHTNNTASCSDNNSCTGPDTCSNGGCVSGPNTCSSPTVHINEVHYDQSSSEQEFIELYAPGAAVDITNWTIADQDEMTYTFGNPTFPCPVPFVLSAGARLVVWQGSGTNVCSGLSPAIYMNRSTFLQNAGDDVVLKRADGVCQDYVGFENGLKLNPAPAGCAWTGTNPSNGNVVGRSISRFDSSPFANNHSGADWEASGTTSTTGPTTPGLSNQAAAADTDGDGVLDSVDNCRFVANPDQADGDGDGAGTACDNCVGVFNPDQADGDGDTIGDACDACPNGVSGDPDGDGLCGAGDNCPLVANPDQTDANHNNIGDACEGHVFANIWVNGQDIRSDAPGIAQHAQQSAQRAGRRGSVRYRTLGWIDATMIPAGSTILSVAVVYHTTSGDPSNIDPNGDTPPSGGPITVEVHEVLKAWNYDEPQTYPPNLSDNEAAVAAGQTTWRDTINPAQWQALGAAGATDAGPTLATLTVTSALDTRFEFASPAIVQLVQRWVNGVSPNHGYMLRAVDADENAAIDNRKIFCGKGFPLETSTGLSQSVAISHRPFVRVEYQTP